MPAEIAQLVVKSGFRLERPELCPQHLYSSMLRCWIQAPSRRPSFSILNGLLQMIGHEESASVSLFLIDAVEWVCSFSNLPNTDIGDELTANCRPACSRRMTRGTRFPHLRRLSRLAGCLCMR